MAHSQYLSLRSETVHQYILPILSFIVSIIVRLLVRFLISENNQSKIAVSPIILENFSKSSLLFVYIEPFLENLGLDVIT